MCVWEGVYVCACVRAWCLKYTVSSTECKTRCHALIITSNISIFTRVPTGRTTGIHDSLSKGMNANARNQDSKGARANAIENKTVKR